MNNFLKITAVMILSLIIATGCKKEVSVTGVSLEGTPKNSIISKKTL
jgi:hypothetical protein